MFLILGAILFAGLGFSLEHRSAVAMADFKPLFYGARCLLTGCDLYSQEQLQRLYFAESDEPQPEKLKLINNVVWSYYPPATYMLVTPLAALPWRVAHVLWMILKPPARNSCLPHSLCGSLDRDLRRWPAASLFACSSPARSYC